MHLALHLVMHVGIMWAYAGHTCISSLRSFPFATRTRMRAHAQDARRGWAGGCNATRVRHEKKCTAGIDTVSDLCDYVLTVPGHGVRTGMGETNMAENAIARKWYINANGERAKSASPDAVALVWEFANAESRTVKLSDFNQTVLQCAAWHGLSQKLGDKYAGKTAEEAVELFDEQLEAMAGDAGRWLKERESAGPRVGVIAEALHRVRPEKYATLAAAQAEVSGWSDEVRAAKLNVAALAKMVETVKAERRAAKIAKLSDEGAAEL